MQSNGPLPQVCSSWTAVMHHGNFLGSLQVHDAFWVQLATIPPPLEVRVALYVSMCCVYATYSLIAVPCSKHEMKINIIYGRQMLSKGRKNLNLHTPTHTNGLPRRKRLGRRRKAMGRCPASGQTHNGSNLDYPRLHPPTTSPVQKLIHPSTCR